MDAQRGRAQESSEMVEVLGASATNSLARARYDPDREALWAKWRKENSQAIAASNAWYEKNGHPLAAYMIKPGDPLPR